jgi:uncharacterized protein YjbJ (UPF0337 family)
VFAEQDSYEDYQNPVKPVGHIDEPFGHLVGNDKLRAEGSQSEGRRGIIGCFR